MRLLLILFLLLPLQAQAQPVTIESSMGRVSVTADAVTYNLPGRQATVSRDILSALPRANAYQWTSKDIALLVDVYEWEGGAVPEWPAFASEDLLTLLAELEVEVDAVLSRLGAKDLQIGELEAENARLAAALEEAGDTSALEAEIASLRATNASLAGQLQSMSQANEAAIVLLTRLLNAVKQ
jgi:hypothetical protein